MSDGREVCAADSRGEHGPTTYAGHVRDRAHLGSRPYCILSRLTRGICIKDREIMSRSAVSQVFAYVSRQIQQFKSR